MKCSVVAQHNVWCGGPTAVHVGWEMWADVFQFIELYHLMNVYAYFTCGSVACI